MRAFAIDRFEEPGAVRELPTPEPEEGEVLLHVRAAGMNAFDVAVAKGFIKDAMEHRFPVIPGLDASGVIEAAGAGVDAPSVGDEVYGIVQKPFLGRGTYAEYVAMPAGGATRKPASLDHLGAAALPTAALTALAAVEMTDPREGQIVLVIGATGGVGSYVTQLAATRRARVVAVARGDYAEYARTLGASDTIDYTAGDLVELVRAAYPGGVDAVIDLAGDKELVARLAELVSSGGALASSVGAVDDALVERRGLRGGNANRAGLDRLPELTPLVEEGVLRIPELRVFPLHQAGEALDELAGRHVKGKLVLQVS